MTRAVPLPVAAPFQLEATVRLLQRRPSNRVDRFEGGRYRRALETGEGVSLFEVTDGGAPPDAPRLELRIVAGASSAAARSECAAAARRILGLDLAPSLFARFEADPRLGPLARRLRGMRPPRFPTLSEAFANVIPFQQVSLESGAAVVGRLVERLGRGIAADGSIYFSFPGAERIAARPEALRAAGLSRRKAEALAGAARQIEAGRLSEERLGAVPTLVAAEELRRLPGIGPWSAGVLLLRGLGRLDSFPPGDVGASAGLSQLLRIRREAVEAYAARFGPVRGHLYFYALAASLLSKGLIGAPGPDGVHASLQ